MENEDKACIEHLNIWVSKYDYECYQFYKSASHEDYPDCQPETKEDCLSQIETYKKLAIGCDYSCWHKERYSNSARRAYGKLKLLLPIYDMGVDWGFYGDGMLRFPKGNKGNPLIYAIISGKWRQEGKNKWYRSRSLVDFIERYVYEQ